MARSGSLAGTPSTSNISTELTIAGKMAPRPSSPFRRSTVNVRARSMARARRLRGNSGSATRTTASSARNTPTQSGLWCGARAGSRVDWAGRRNSSSMPILRGLRARGRRLFSTSSGTITVRAQYETLERWNGNHCGSSMISTGIIGTACHGITPYRASRVRVKTLLASAPPMPWMAARARRMCAASGSSPAILSAK
ncbi:hypothetical protein D3C85_1080460 [compost metagenome]